MSDLIGQVIDSYRVEGKLGEGGMGMVFAARHTRLTHLRAAIKLLVAEYARHEQIRARFFREAEAVSKFDHPHIINVLGFGELSDGQLYLMMPLLQGKPLDQHMGEGNKLVAHHVLDLVAQTASALHYAHKHGVIHRDLKPGNIFLERRREHPYFVRLLDFGIAKDAHDVSNSQARTRTGLALGTPYYMACEQYDDASTVTPAADVFSLAVVIVQMLSGQLPWGWHPPGPLYFKQKTEEPTLTADIPRAWVPILRAALSPDPARRPQSTRDLIIALANELPAQVPVWGSGAQIVHDVARDLITDAAPDDATVRNSGSTVPVSAPAVSYPPTHVPMVAPSMPHAQRALSAPGASSASSQTPALASTVNERPASAVGPSAPPMTTLSASSGVAIPSTSRAPKRTMLALLGVGGAALAGALTFAVARMRGGGDDSSAQRPAATEATSLPRSPADAGVGPVPAATQETVSASLPDAGTAANAPDPATPSAATASSVAPTSNVPQRTTSTRTKLTSIKRSTSDTKPIPSRETDARSTPGASSTPTPSAGQQTGPRTFDPDAIKE